VSDRSLGEQLGLWGDQLHAIAAEGPLYVGDRHYDQVRYEKVRRVGAELWALQSEASADEVEARFVGDPFHLCPFVGVDAAVLDDDGRILLIQREDDRLWAMPGGQLDVHETPAEGACREALEESGVACEALRLLGVWDSRADGSGFPYHLLHLVFLCRPTADEPLRETLDVGWFAADALPPLSRGHRTRVPAALAMAADLRVPPHFDATA
jgi:8-oxo-dGTP pyrophosphatase MutT (NUDIX family)